jgi:hypothetical protein
MNDSEELSLERSEKSSEICSANMQVIEDVSLSLKMTIRGLSTVAKV